MNPVYLVQEPGGERVAVACGTCGNLWSLRASAAETFATTCCDREAQRRVSDASYAASKAARAARELTLLAEAARVPEADYQGGMIFWDGTREKDGYFSDPDDLEEWCYDNGEALPAEVWGCTKRAFRLPSAEDLVEQEAQQDHHDDVTDNLTDTADLQRALDAWNARQTAATYYPDYTVRVVLAPERVRVAAERAAEAAKLERLAIGEGPK